MSRMMLNPSVRSVAEQYTDGVVTEDMLRDAARREGLPLYVEDGPRPAAPWRYVPDSAAIRRQIVVAEYRRRNAERLLAQADRELAALRWQLTERLDAEARERGL